MVTITLPPELEQVVTERAHGQGTTPELLAIDSLEKLYLSPAVRPDEDESELILEVGWAADNHAAWRGIVTALRV